MRSAEELFEDYARFHEVQLANRDVDPVYPVLRALADSSGWTPEERVRAVFLHVAYYDLGSALAHIDKWGFTFARKEKLTCGTERRRHRMGNNLDTHLHWLNCMCDWPHDLRSWMTRELGDDPVANWAVATERLMRVDGNGRWAAYKTCEMLAQVCELPLRAPDMGHRGSTGPRQGLALLYPGASATGNTATVIAQLDGYSTQLVKALQARGLSASLETAETTLCDFHSMVHGRYYPGLDIDVMQEQLTRAPLSASMLNAAGLARERSLPHAYLGEMHARDRPERERKSHYKRTGEILTRGGE